MDENLHSFRPKNFSNEEGVFIAVKAFESNQVIAIASPFKGAVENSVNARDRELMASSVAAYAGILARVKEEALEYSKEFARQFGYRAEPVILRGIDGGYLPVVAIPGSQPEAFCSLALNTTDSVFRLAERNDETGADDGYYLVDHLQFRTMADFYPFLFGGPRAVNHRKIEEEAKRIAWGQIGQPGDAAEYIKRLTF